MLIALDLDGTLLNGRGEVSSRAVAAVAAVCAVGHRVVIATGRPPQMAMPVTRELVGHVSHIVGGNGSIISTFPHATDQEPQMIHLIGFRYDDAAHVVATMRADQPGFGFAMATDAGFAHEPGFQDLMPASVPSEPVDDVLDLGGTIVFKLFAYHRSHSVHDLMASLPALLSARPPGGGWTVPLSVNHMGADAIEIGPATSDKAAGLQWLCDELHVDPADVVAIGDESNDLTMLEWAGRGVAMGNADHRVKAVANEVIAANTDEGVARFLETLI